MKGGEGFEFEERKVDEHSIPLSYISRGAPLSEFDEPPRGYGVDHFDLVSLILAERQRSAGCPRSGLPVRVLAGEFGVGTL